MNSPPPAAKLRLRQRTSDELAPAERRSLMVAWARFIELPLSELPRLTELLMRMMQRPSVQATLRGEGMMDSAGRFTPPAAA